MQTELVKGSTEPILGWYSPSFQIKEPTKVVYNSCELKSTTTLSTVIKVIET